MDTLKYKVIKSRKQYNVYCRQLEFLLTKGGKNKLLREEADLLKLLVQKWDQDHNSFHEVEPIVLLKSLMESNNMKAADLANLLGVSKGLVSDILNYKKGLSKAIIRKLSEAFKVSHEAFNRHYELTGAGRVNTNNSVEIKSLQEVMERHIKYQTFVKKSKK